MSKCHDMSLTVKFLITLCCCVGVQAIPLDECPALPQCPRPPPGCNWLFTKDENDCIVSCAPLECTPCPFCPPCSNGHVRDETDCESCGCGDIECPPLPPCPRPPPGCNYVFERDENDCIISCGRLDCPCQERPCAPCPKGYVQDENGCDTCECKECPPLPQCPAPPPGCNWLFTKDENDCIVSCAPLECTPCPFCPPCSNGHVRDETDCESCECGETCPDPPSCPAPGDECTFIPVNDENGCLIGCDYDCEDIECPPLPPCPRPPPGCNYVFERDENDCIISCGRLDCQCQERLCAPCPNGYVQDENGCDTCECKDNCPPPPPNCGPSPKGCIRRPVNDDNGCLIGYDVECKCPQLKCQSCPDGYVQDDKGCNTCRCKNKRRGYFNLRRRDQE